METDPEKAAERLRNLIGPEFTAQIQWNKQSPYLLREWRTLLERMGVIVFRFDFPIEDSRGFSLFDEVAPVITISTNDTQNASIFSLFHELSHLLHHQSCTCNDLEFGSKNHTEAERMEVFCNHFAGAYLVPENDLLNHPIVKKTKNDS
jgi:Zn-dependent peptidase ImmA (M78 family)